MLFDAVFWRSAAERAIRTCAQALVAILGTTAVGVASFDWAQALTIAGMATTLSVATSIVATGVGDKGTPSLVEGGE